MTFLKVINFSKEIHKFPIPKNSVATAHIFEIIIIATWIDNTEDYKSVVDMLLEKGVKDINQHKYFNKIFWRE